MPGGSPTDPRTLFAGGPVEDFLGHDPLARSLLRGITCLDPGSVVLLHGAPGSGAISLMLRCAYFLDRDRNGIGLDQPDALDPAWVWYNPWLFQHRGHVLSGLVITLAQFASRGPQAMEKAREIIARLNRLKLPGQAFEGAVGTALEPGELGPVDRVRLNFRGLVNSVRRSGTGRLVVFVADADLLAPDLRLALLEGLRMILEPQTEVTLVVAMGRQAAHAAVRLREGPLSEDAAHRWLAPFVDLRLNVPKVEVRRIGTVLRRYVGAHSDRITRAFGNDAALSLAAAAAHAPLGNPGFLQSLAKRLVLMAEFAVEIRATRELSEAQWAWFIIAERWPTFRRLFLRGGRDRWEELRGTLGGAIDSDPTRIPSSHGSELYEHLRADPVLAAYLRLHGDGFQRDSDGIQWVDGLMRQAGL